ncbi:MerR family transcriptional regulator [Xylocopilactobacillus apis]|uniref:Transcriptional regulator n=1 Tax=Xylocopilactobacillus apis TaxID=2932183 RepID=A0AAU9DNQ6_9LACO|nr:MerR family transcriptional regulator [Xylocopilactobacillus apis]BDR57379.1 transcriptional regulator [Xylocopilactobacillus apis]
MNINQCSKVTNCSKDTLRYYDKKGLVSPTRSNNGYRDYDKEDLKKIQIIQTLKYAGLDLNEIQLVLNLLNSPISEACYKDSISFLNKKNGQFKELIKFYQNLNDITEQIMSAVENKEFSKANNLIWNINGGEQA